MRCKWPPWRVFENFNVAGNCVPEISLESLCVLFSEEICGFYTFNSSGISHLLHFHWKGRSLCDFLPPLFCSEHSRYSAHQPCSALSASNMPEKLRQCSIKEQFSSQGLLWEACLPSHYLTMGVLRQARIAPFPTSATNCPALPTHAQGACSSWRKQEDLLQLLYNAGHAGKLKFGFQVLNMEVCKQEDI